MTADSALLDPTAWDVLLLPYIGSSTNASSANGTVRVFACAAEVVLPVTTFPTATYPFQIDYCANDYIFHDTTHNLNKALRSTQVGAPSSILLMTEKKWNSPRYQPDSPTWADWLAAWNNPNPASKNSPGSGLDRHNKVHPVLAAADGHSTRWLVPTYKANNAGESSFPGLGDARLDSPTSSLQSWANQSGADFWMRDHTTAAGF
jgi:hypothetical protein